LVIFVAGWCFTATTPAGAKKKNENKRHCYFEHFGHGNILSKIIVAATQSS
jgi:hypothetical protein